MRQARAASEAAMATNSTTISSNIRTMICLLGRVDTGRWVVFTGLRPAEPTPAAPASPQPCGDPPALACAPVRRTETVDIWALPEEQVYQELGTSPKGLVAADAASRLQKHGKNVLPTKVGRLAHRVRFA